MQTPPNPPAQTPTWKSLRGTFVGAGLVTMFISQKHMGVAVIFEGLFLTPWLVVWLWKAIRRPGQRALPLAKTIVWLLSIAVVVGAHFYQAHKTRVAAQTLVDAVLAYHSMHGQYPENLQSVGYSREQVSTMIGPGSYAGNNGRPIFFYASTYVPFETDSFDFNSHAWQHDFD